jgi:hypothetical protein
MGAIATFEVGQWRKVPEKKIDSRQDVMKSEIDSIDVVINQEYMNI